jgi:head-tail adaptor
MKLRAGEMRCEVTVEKIAVAGDEGYLEPDSTYGTAQVVWIPLVALAGSPPVGERFPATIQDVLPSRAESVTMGLSVAKNQSTLRMRYRNDITSAMRVTVHRDSDQIYSIVGGPALIDGKKERIEMQLEKVSS